MLRAELSWFTAHCWEVVPVSLKASEGSLIFTVGALSMHLCMELSAQTWRQSHCCSLSTPVMSHNAIMGFAQRQTPRKVLSARVWPFIQQWCRSGYFLCNTAAHWAHTSCQLGHSLHSNTLHLMVPKKQSPGLTALHFGYFHTGRYSTVRGKRRGLCYPIFCMNSLGTQGLLVWHQTKLVLEMPILEPDFFFPAAST